MKKSPVRLLSLSIDIAGSTAAKQRIVQLSEPDSDHRVQLYEHYRRTLFGVEEMFYGLIAAQNKFPVSKLFLVKSIGDEYWFVCDVPEHDSFAIKSDAAALINALLALMSKRFSLSLCSQFVPEEMDISGEVPRDARVEHVPIRIKAAIDVLDDGIEVNLERYNFLKHRLHKYHANQSVDESTRASLMADLMNRLNIGAAEANETKVRSICRTDYIGLDVDRFFRISKHCVPSILLLGGRLAEELQITSNSVNGQVGAAQYYVPFDRSGGSGLVQHQIVSSVLKSGELNGLSKDYQVHHLFGTSVIDASIWTDQPSEGSSDAKTKTFLESCGYFNLPTSQRIT